MIFASQKYLRCRFLPLSYYHIHSSLSERLKAVHSLRFSHSIKTLCKVLKVNRRAYYKHFHSAPSKKALENQKFPSAILSIYSAAKKRLGVYKI